MAALSVCVIIPAAGASQRYSAGMGVGRSKLDEDLGGRPVLHRTVELFTNVPEVRSIVVAGPADDEAFAAFKLRHGDKLAIYGVKLCKGGKNHRYETVRNALALVPSEATHVAVHDAARPCASAELIRRVFDAAKEFPAVIPAVAVADTIKRVGPEMERSAADPLAAILGAEGDQRPKVRGVEGTVDRSALVAVQTPQVFEKGLLLRAYGQKDLESTDDAQLVERLGERVVTIPGDSSNLKITRAGDMALVRAILGFKAAEEKPAHLRF